MELVKFVYTKNSALTESVNGHTFLEEWTEMFNNVGFYNFGVGNNEQKVAGKLNLDDQCKEFLRLKLDFSTNQLMCDGVNIGDMSQQSWTPETAAATTPTSVTHDDKNEELATFRMQKKVIESRGQDAIARKTTVATFRNALYPEQSSLLSVPNVPSIIVQRVQHEVVYIVQIFRPVSADEKYNFRKHQFMPKKLDHIIAVLGSQPLTALRDKIQCCSDYIILGEYSDDPDPKKFCSGKEAKDVFKSAFFYIGDTFYNDLRYDDCVNYSSDLIEHSKDPNRSLGPFYSKTMEETKFKELNIQLGYPYLYLHQGNCEHIIVFSDIRLLDLNESHNIEDYPFICRGAQRRRVVCMICNTFTARWVTIGNKRVSNDPYFFCDFCFYSFNYTGDGKKIGSFKAYGYVDRTAI